MRPFRLIVLGSTAFAVVAMLLPFATFPVIGPVDGIAADAWPALIPLLIAMIVVMTTRWTDDLEPTAGLVAVFAAGASLLFCVVKISDAVIAVREAAGATLGPGSMVLTTAVAAVTAGVAAGVLSRR